MGGLQVHVLGPAVVGRADDDDTSGATVVPVRRLLERGLLARLALARGAVVPDATLAADLWDVDDGGDGDDPVARIARLRVVVSRVRRTLGAAADAVVRSGGGYRLVADAPDLGAARAAAERLRAATRTGDDGAARSAAADALAAWRGPSLADLRALPFGRDEGERLDTWRVELSVRRVSADVALGAGGEVVAELAELTARDPLHEPLRCLLAVALYRSGRQADALAELAGLRRALADDLGVDPTEDTARLEVRLLRQDPTLRGAPAAGAIAASDIRPALARGLVGRRPELVTLAGRLAAATSGEASVVLVEGPPGSGRTRLLEALADLAVPQGLTVCHGRGASTGAAPFRPWRQALRRWRQRTEPDAVARVVDRVGGPIARIVPEVAPARAVPEAVSGAGSSPLLDPEDRFAVFEQVVAFLEAAAADGPGLVLILDDLHTADLGSLLLLGHLAASGSRSRLLVAAALRRDELGPDQVRARAELLDERATLIELGGLPSAAVAEQLAIVLGHECAPDVAADVARRTGGNPLFVQEVGRLMAAGGSGVPGAVRDVVRRRLDALPAACRDVLAAAAVLGGEVDAEVVAAGAERPVADVLDELDRAVGAGLLAEGERPGRTRFAHEIVREAIALDLATGARAGLHLRAAEYLAAVGAPVAQVAHHRLTALPLGDRELALDEATSAADLALRRFAFEDAADLYRRALGIGPGVDSPRRAELLLAAARAQYLGEDVAGAMRSGEEAAAIADHLGDMPLLGRAATLLPDLGDPDWLARTRRWSRDALGRLPAGDDPLRARLMAQLAVASIWADDGVSRDGAAGPDGTGHAALRMAERVGDAAATYTALRAQQLAHAGPDGTPARLALADRMLGLVPAVGDTAELWGRLWRFDALVQLGRVDEADDELDLLAPLVARMRRPLPRWHLIRSRSALLCGRGRFAEARAAADEAVRAAERGRHRAAEYPAHALRLTIAELTGDPVDPVVFEVEGSHPPPRILSMMAALRHAVHGDAGEAARIRERLPPMAEATVRPFMHLMAYAVDGVLAAMVGDGPAADRAYAALLPHAHLHVTVGAGVGNTGGSVHLALGTIAAARDRGDAAVEHLRAAMAANEASGLVPYATLARARLAGELRRRGGAADLEEAAGLARLAAATASRLGMPLPSG